MSHIYIYKNFYGEHLILNIIRGSWFKLDTNILIKRYGKLCCAVGIIQSDCKTRQLTESECDAIELKYGINTRVGFM